MWDPELEKLKESLIEEFSLPVPNYSEYELHLLECAKNKEMLTIQEQIDYLRLKNIKFEVEDEQEIRRVLSDVSYYFKLTVYRKNFEKDKYGRYLDLSFKQLSELAKIDMYLRDILGRMSLEIEHSLKTLIINILTNSNRIDGYEIVDAYDKYEKDRFVQLKKKNGEDSSIEDIDFFLKDYVPASQTILRRAKNKKGYDRDLFEKHNRKPSIWVLIELMSLGELASFLRYYVDNELYDSKKLKDGKHLISQLCNIRNAYAHIRPLIYNITNSNEIELVATKVWKYAEHCGVEKRRAMRLLTNRKINDIVVTIQLHDIYVKTEKMKIARKNELIKWLHRTEEARDIFKNSIDFINIYEFFQQIIQGYGTGSDSKLGL